MIKYYLSHETFELASTDLKVIRKALEKELCDECLGEAIGEHCLMAFENRTEIDKIYLMLDTLCGKEYAVLRKYVDEGGLKND